LNAELSPGAAVPVVELLEVVDELPLVEVDSPELVAAGRVVTPGVVKSSRTRRGRCTRRATPVKWRK